MHTTKRKIIKIDEEKCDGCALCIPSCPEGALKIVNGKAKLVSESFCDGLGACLGDCPAGALIIDELEVEEYDEEGVISHIKANSPELLEKHVAHLRDHAHEFPQQPAQVDYPSCPSARTLHWQNHAAPEPETLAATSELRQWPIQLHLVSPAAPYFNGADLVLVADCVPFAYANFHSDFLRGNAIAIACPKLDNVEPYVEKIARIITNSRIRSLKVVVMEVPCCFGLTHIAREALSRSGMEIPFEQVVIGIDGEARTAIANR